jgi:DNA-binding cell septation regulator SpoVG
MTETKNTAAPETAAEVPPLKLDVTARLIEPKGNLLGFASIVLNDSFVIDDISIVRGKTGIFAGMPSKPDPSKPSGYKQTARALGDFRGQLNGAVAEAYHAQVEKIKAHAMAHGEHAQSAEQGKPSIKKDIAEGKRQAEKNNAARAGEGPSQIKDRQQPQGQTAPGGR